MHGCPTAAVESTSVRAAAVTSLAGRRTPHAAGASRGRPDGSGLAVAGFIHVVSGIHRYGCIRNERNPGTVVARARAAYRYRVYA
eukprot:COSAG02_NODE_7414_length_3025_cov_59.395967_2_plen_85_part_00